MNQLHSTRTILVSLLFVTLCCVLSAQTASQPQQDVKAVSDAYAGVPYVLKLSVPIIAHASATQRIAQRPNQPGSHATTGRLTITKEDLAQAASQNDIQIRLSNFKTGPASEGKALPQSAAVGLGRPETITISPQMVSRQDGEKIYEQATASIQWTPKGQEGQSDVTPGDAPIGVILKMLYPDFDKYTRYVSYSVDLTLQGKSQSYNAMAFLAMDCLFCS